MACAGSERGRRVCYDGLMSKTVEAVYEDGVFRPIERPEGIVEHGRVFLTVTVASTPSSCQDFGERISADDAADMRKIVEQEFEGVDLRDWQ